MLVFTAHVNVNARISQCGKQNLRVTTIMCVISWNCVAKMLPSLNYSEWR